MLVYLLIFLNTATPTIETAMSLYKENQFDEALAQFEELKQIMTSDEDIYYYLALCYAKKGMPEQTLEALKPLLDRDPTYYLYKVNFDLDFASILENQLFQEGIQNYQAYYLAKDTQSQDRIAVRGNILTLYRNGIQHVLHEGLENSYQAKFVNSHYLYFSWSWLEKRKEMVGVSLYHRSGKISKELYQGPGPLTTIQIEKIKGKHLLVFGIPHRFFIYQLDPQEESFLQEYQGDFLPPSYLETFF